MVIWLRSAKSIPTLTAGIGIEGGVIDRESLGSLITLDDGFVALEKERKAWNKELKNLRQKAKEEAAEAFEQAQQQGYMQGQQQAVQEWQKRMVEMLGNARHIQARMRVRLSELVANAVEHIVRTTDRRDLFARAMATLEQISDGASLLNVRVHADEVKAAQEAFEEFAKEWSARGQPIKVIVQADSALALGSCLCETEFGMIDASLEVQLQAMRSALGRALAQGHDELVEGLLAQVQPDADASEAALLDVPIAPLLDNEGEHYENAQAKSAQVASEDPTPFSETVQADPIESSKKTRTRRAAPLSAASQQTKEIEAEALEKDPPVKAPTKRRKKEPQVSLDEALFEKPLLPNSEI